MKNCRIFACTCNHQFQDELYGRRMRVFNPRKAPGEYTCTVCNAKKTDDAEKSAGKQTKQAASK